MSPDSSAHLLKVHGEIDGLLKQSLAFVKSNEASDNYLAYRDIVAEIMEVTLTRLVNPLCRQHPQLKPASLFIPDTYMKKDDDSGL
jgi:hypothetical protein